ncbi:methyltransferase [Vallitalea sp.]|uniref:methyltransferase n=1 Tax=Vallitalea sp. TaxID=1882829 RepID=UPI0025FE9CC1|nr:methyltransferase [Vallitalea sp.]MCT4688467.1 acetylserotonin O-methyltransferase [Vallitalea sp.]
MNNNKLAINTYYTMVNNYRETQLFFAALKLDIFSYLDDEILIEEIANQSKYDIRNLKLTLNALASIKLIEKHQNKYVNTEEGKIYLSKLSKYYIGDAILFRNEMMSLDNIENRVRYGPDKAIAQHNQGQKVYDFTKLAKVCIPEIYLWRIEPLINLMNKIYQDTKPSKILDLGGGSGAMGIELCKAFPSSKGVIFEEPNVSLVAEDLVSKNNLSSRITVQKGDFIKDDIGNGYDIIIASGIIDFAKDHLQDFVKKLYDALNKNGIIYLITHGFSEDYLEPSETILGWLSSHLDGLDLLLPDKVIQDAMTSNGFKLYSQDKSGNHSIKVYQK